MSRLEKAVERLMADKENREFWVDLRRYMISIIWLIRTHKAADSGWSVLDGALVHLVRDIETQFTLRCYDFDAEEHRQSKRPRTTVP